ncbi:MAG: cell surface receptor domain protein, partial [Candidatus Saccharibacteria bacterium]|nr:cell surface receptor domain protein [Candidatus Saccharibacteria bacterium]
MKNLLTARLRSALYSTRVMLGIPVVVATSFLLTPPAQLHAAVVPTVTSVTPNSGLKSGGDSVTITGANFDSAATVKIGATVAASTTWVDSTTLTAVTPAGVAGARDVTVTNSDGQQAILAKAFTYIEPTPTISSVTPAKGPAGGGQSVTITGQNFTPGWKEISQITSGANHSCGIYDSQAYCWGINTYGQLGNNTRNASSAPVAVDTSGVLSGKTIISVAAGVGHTCAVASDNQTYCWGYNAYGQLGNNSAVTSYKPVAVDTAGVLASKTVLSIATGGYHTCAVTSDNLMYCWGYNYYGALGNNSTTQSNVPVAVTTTGVLNGKTVTSITAGDYHTCAIASDSQAYCWGYNAYGQLGNNSTAQSTVPVAVVTTGVLNGKTVSSITTGATHTCAVASDNLSYCWGDGGNGQLGNNSTTSSSVPVATVTTGVLNGKTVSSIVAGAKHTCAVASDSQAYCWGYNGYGQLGNNSTGQSTVPVAVTATGILAGKTVLSFATDGHHTCAVASDNQAYCWGQNINGQLGNSSLTNSSVAVAVQQISIRMPIVKFGTALATNVQVVSNTSLSVVSPAASAGIATVSVTSYDNQIATLSNAYTFEAGPQASGVTPTAGIISGGDTITITGTNFTTASTVLIANVAATSVTVVDSTTLTAVTPAGVAGARDIKVVSADGQQSVLSAGFLYRDLAPVISSVTPAKGPAGGGQSVTITGQNFTPGWKEISQITGGANHSCGIYNGQAYCWGINTYGQLGNNSTNTSSVPVAVDTSGVLAGKTILSIEAGD